MRIREETLPCVIGGAGAAFQFIGIITPACDYNLFFFQTQQCPHAPRGRHFLDPQFFCDPCFEQHPRPCEGAREPTIEVCEGAREPTIEVSEPNIMSFVIAGWSYLRAVSDVKLTIGLFSCLIQSRQLEEFRPPPPPSGFANARNLQ